MELEGQQVVTSGVQGRATAMLKGLEHPLHERVWECSAGSRADSGGLCPCVYTPDGREGRQRQALPSDAQCQDQRQPAQTETREIPLKLFSKVCLFVFLKTPTFFTVRLIKQAAWNRLPREVVSPPPVKPQTHRGGKASGAPGVPAQAGSAAAGCPGPSPVWF